MSYTLGNIDLNTETVTLSGLGSDYYNNTVWTTATDAIWNGTNGVSIADTKPSARITLQGDDADIDINGRSLGDFMKQVEQRLAILEPNPELEKEWAELRELGDQYRALEQYIKDKMKTWDILNKE